MSTDPAITLQSLFFNQGPNIYLCSKDLISQHEKSIRKSYGELELKFFYLPLIEWKKHKLIEYIFTQIYWIYFFWWNFSSHFFTIAKPNETKKIRNKMDKFLQKGKLRLVRKGRNNNVKWRSKNKNNCHFGVPSIHFMFQFFHQFFIYIFTFFC